METNPLQPSAQHRNGAIIADVAHEENPAGLIDLAIDQTLPADVRRHAAERLNDLRGATLGYIQYCPDRALIGKLARCGLIASDFSAFAKARLATLDKKLEKPTERSTEETIEEKVARLEKENAELAKTVKRQSNGHQAKTAAYYQEALRRAQSCSSIGNMAEVTRGMLNKGIALADIKPGENCLTYDAWQALGRQVRLNEHGVHVASITRITKEQDNPETGESEKVSFKRFTNPAIFHITQTDAKRSN